MKFFKKISECALSSEIRMSRVEEAIMSGDLETAKLYVSRNLPLNSVRPAMGMPLLALATQRKELKIMELLLSNGASADTIFACDWTVLYLASSVGFLEGVELLVLHQAKLEVRSLHGLTCLHAAAQGQHLKTVNYLVSVGADVKAQDAEGQTGLHYAVLADDVRVAVFFIKRGAEIDAQTNSGDTAVLLATRKQKINLVRTLLEAGANPYIPNERGISPLGQAIRDGNVDIVRLLLSHRACRSTSERERYLELAVDEDKADIAEILIDNTNYQEDTGPSSGVDQVVKVGPAGEPEQKKFVDLENLTCCPITMDVMTDPVIAADGHTYERSAIEDWLKRSNSSPITREPLASTNLYPNLSIRQLITETTPPNETQHSIMSVGF